MNCNKTSNNKYFDCPALMSDGRIMTDYRSSIPNVIFGLLAFYLYLNARK